MWRRARARVSVARDLSSTCATKPSTYTFEKELYARRIRGESNFVDLKVVKLSSGKGGDGKVSFQRLANRAKGPADGGDGGAGGAVYVQAVEGVTCLRHLRSQYRAGGGRVGGSNQLYGKTGDNVVIRVPVGTTIHLLRTDDEVCLNSKSQMIQMHRESNHKTDYEGWVFKDKPEEYLVERDYFKRLARDYAVKESAIVYEENDTDVFPVEGVDLSTCGPPLLLLQGGRGGAGNMHFHNEYIRNPRFARGGRSGLAAAFVFELKLLADVALLGLPNAGKSTLLRGISRATPRVGDYAFTTLVPSVGTITRGPESVSFRVADIPGIISGARFNKGLGLDFLRHTERARALAFVIGLDSADPVADMAVLRTELGPRLNKKNVLVVATKADVSGTQSKYETLRSKATELGYAIVACSGLQQENMSTVVRAMEILLDDKCPLKET